MNTHAALIDEINRTQTHPGQCALWWLGQHSFVAKLGEEIIYIDPFLSHLDDRQIPPLVYAKEVTHATAILGSHDHVDHIDRAAWPALAAASPGAKFVVPKLLRKRIVDEVKIADERVLGVDLGIHVKIKALEITAVPAAHELLDVDENTGLHPYVGFVIRGNGFCLYHAGDTCIYEGMQAILRQWKIDLALLPINGRSARQLSTGLIGNMTYQEAVDLAGAISPGLTLPAHFEMFAANSEDPQLFIDYMKVKYPTLKSAIPRHGQRMIIESFVK